MILSHDGLRGAARAMARTVTSPAAAAAVNGRAAERDAAPGTAVTP